MMKKRVLALLLALLLLPACALGGGAGFLRQMQYGEMVDYENMAFGYALKMFSKFTMYPDDVLEKLWAEVEAQRQEGDDELYDFRYWLSPDSNYLFQVQVKEPTCDSFETEVAKAPEYLSLVQADMEASGYTNITQLHPGVLRDTPAGQMLETAVAYDTVQNGQTYHVVSMYYDYYYEDVEYIFQVLAFGQSYEDAQALLDAIAQTVEIIPRDKVV